MSRLRLSASQIASLQSAMIQTSALMVLPLHQNTLLDNTPTDVFKPWHVQCNTHYVAYAFCLYVLSRMFVPVVYELMYFTFFLPVIGLFYTNIILMTRSVFVTVIAFVCIIVAFVHHVVLVEETLICFFCCTHVLIFCCIHNHVWFKSLICANVAITVAVFVCMRYFNVLFYECLYVFHVMVICSILCYVCNHPPKQCKIMIESIQ